MANVERPIEAQESQSVLNSRLFRAGLLFTALGGIYAVVAGKWGFAATGVILTGVAWAWWKGKK